MLRPDTTPLVIANSRMVKDEIAVCFDYPPERIHVIYNGIPAREGPRQRRGEVRSRLGLADGDLTILFAGSGWERKGLRFAINAVNAMPGGAVLLVAGRGNPKGLPASSRVSYLGAVSDMAGYFEAADIFLLPTLYDPFSNACLEATAAGLPVITTTANGFAEVIEAGVEGEVLENPADAEKMGAAIERWRDPARRREVKPRLALIAQGLSMDANVKATLRLLETWALRKGAPSARS